MKDRIALVVDGDVFASGGVQSSAQRIAQSLAAAGAFDVDVVMLRPDRGRPAAADFYDATPVGERDGVRFYELPALSETAQQPERSFSVHLGLVELFRRNRYRLVHGLYASVAGFHTAFAAAECDIPVVVGLRGNDIHADVFRPGHFEHLRWALEHATRVTAVSSEALRRADLLTGCGSRGHVVLNSIDPASYREGTERVVSSAPVVGSLAKFRSKKAVGTLIAAFHLLVKEIPAAHLVLAGSMTPDVEAAVHEVVGTAGLTDKVTLTGGTAREDALRHIRGMDVFVHPALHDGCPNAVLEAMAAGTPIVASAVGAIPEMITDGREGLLVTPAGSPAALCHAIQRMLRQAGGDYAAHAREAIRTRFAPAREIAELTAVYDACLPALGSGPVHSAPYPYRPDPAEQVGTLVKSGAGIGRCG